MKMKYFNKHFNNFLVSYCMHFIFIAYGGMYYSGSYHKYYLYTDGYLR